MPYPAIWCRDPVLVAHMPFQRTSHGTPQLLPLLDYAQHDAPFIQCLCVLTIIVCSLLVLLTPCEGSINCRISSHVI